LPVRLLREAASEKSSEKGVRFAPVSSARMKAITRTASFGRRAKIAVLEHALLQDENQSLDLVDPRACKGV